ncbi:MAG: hypothetical protein HY332_17495 [Chloroflexi bacterium]|nr:hypothetical protein [Chloroflexota bacterium]
MTDTTGFDVRRPWYHGSQQRLTTLRVGSSITQNPDVARAFSHRPSLVTQSDGGRVKHSGTTPGYLYVVAEEVRPEDVYPHPHPVNVSRWEWLTKRELRLQLIEETRVWDEERLSDEQIARLRQRLELAGVTALVEWRAGDGERRLSSHAGST